MPDSGPRTLIVLGAGASSPLPQTDAITRSLCESEYNSTRLYQFVAHQILYGRASFEDVIAALVDVGLAVEQGTALPPWIDKLEAYISRKSLSLWDMLPAAGVAAKHVASRLVTTGGRKPSHQSRICRTIAALGPTAVATLNYDDTILHELPLFYDGFDHARKRSHFDPCFAMVSRTEKRVMLWLHGSVHFNIEGPHPTPDVHSGQICWERDARFAVSQWSGAVRNSMLDLPMVIGKDKPRQILRLPFVHYWSYLADIARDIDRLIVIGYGGSDEHLNHVLQNVAMWRGDALKLVICTKAATWCAAEETLWKLLPNVFNKYTNYRRVVPGRSLQEVPRPPVRVQNLPRVWIDLDGVEDLARSRTLKQLTGIMQRQ